MKIFSGTSNRPLAEKIAKHLDKNLSGIEIYAFPDKEKRVRIEEKVLGEETVIIQSTSSPVNESYMELFLITDALKRSGAKSVKAVIPYLGYQRQDHIFRDGEAVSLEVVAKILGELGIGEIFSFDLHTPKIPEIFTVPFHDLSALSIFSEKISKSVVRNGEPFVLVSPDMGGIRRIKEIAQMLGNVPFATIVKNRNLDTGAIRDDGLDGDVRGKTAIIVDDMISTGTTMVDAADLLSENGATKVLAFATHAVLANEAAENLQKSGIEKVFVTDTILISSEMQFPKLEVLSIAETAAKALRNL